MAGRDQATNQLKTFAESKKVIFVDVVLKSYITRFLLYIEILCNLLYSNII